MGLKLEYYLDRKCNFGGKGLTVQTRYNKIGDYFMQPYTI